MQKRFITELRIRVIVGYEFMKHVGSSAHWRHEEGAALCGWVPVHGEDWAGALGLARQQVNTEALVALT